MKPETNLLTMQKHNDITSKRLCNRGDTVSRHAMYSL
jgi:hypothetical protein